jgi:hypothetical protein
MTGAQGRRRLREHGRGGYGGEAATRPAACGHDGVKCCEFGQAA